MNFLKKAQETAQQVAGNKASNPLDNNPFKKPALAVKGPETTPGLPKPPGVPGTKPGIPGAKPTLPGAKPTIPGSKPGVPGAKPALPGVKPALATAAPKVEEQKEEVAPVMEEASAPVLPIEKDTEIVAPVEAPAVTQTAPAKKGTTGRGSRGGKKGTTSNAPKTESTEAGEKVDSAETTEIILPTTEVDYTTAVESLKSNFVDEEWEKFRELTVSNLNEIVISDSMNAVALKGTIAKLSGLREDVWLKFIDTKTLFENLAAEKPEGLIERIKKANLIGNNDNERKRNSVIAVMKYKAPDGTEVNLYEVLDETRSRFNFLDGVMRSLQYKTDVLITMLGSIKLENRQGGMS